MTFHSEAVVSDLSEIIVRPAVPSEEHRFKHLMQSHHYLGSLPKISETIWYIATCGDAWVALLTFSASALKCSVRDRWIGWDLRYQYGRLKLITNNSRFLILPDWHLPNLASRVLSLCQKRLPDDWQKRFGHPLLLLETFVDPQRFHGTIYKATNWIYLGETKGFRRTREGYSAKDNSPKMVFVKPLTSHAQIRLSQPSLHPDYRIGGTKMMLTAQHMRTLPDFFTEIPDPRRAQGRRHRLTTILAIAAAATLCGMHGYQAIADWAKDLGQRARRRFDCRKVNGKFLVPSLSIIRDVLIRVDPVHLDRALGQWNAAHAQDDESLAIDGKTMCNAIDADGYRTHILSAIGHQSKNCYTQKK